MGMSNRAPVMASVMLACCLLGETLGTAFSQAPSPFSYPTVSLAPSPFWYPTVSPAPSPSSLSPAPAGSDCVSYQSNMLNCLDYLSPGSKITSPGSDCCKSFKDLVDSPPICLCQLVADSRNSAAFGFRIDRNRFLGIPTACKSKTVPQLSNCAALGYPVRGLGFPTNGASTPGSTEGAPSYSGTPETPKGTGKSDSTGFRPSVLVSVLAALAVTGLTIL